MSPLNFDVDEATLLKAYQLSFLHPQQWEEVDHDFLDDGVSFSGVDSLDQSSRGTEREDLLGLGSYFSVKDLDVATKASLLITSKTFSPSQYLSYVHPNATYRDLVLGAEHLERSLEAREEALKTLVEDALDSFVSVKSAVDSLWAVMGQEILAPETNHATLPLRRYLKTGAQKANQIFLPALETASKAHKVRTTLGVFERSRFFFNLPSFIMESIEAGKYEHALRDYKKGKYLLENRPNQLLPISTSEQSTHLLQQQQQRRILNKIWVNVERAMDEMRKVLVTRLQDPNRSVEEHERTLETLVELEFDEEAVWAYFDSHHAHIMDKMVSAYRDGVNAVKCERQTSCLSDHPQNSLENQLRIAIHRLESKQADIVISTSPAEPTWHAILDLLKSMSETVLGTLRSFWKVSQQFINGKYQKLQPSHAYESRRSPAQCRTMACDIVKLYTSLVSQAFMLSDIAVMSKTDSSENPDLPPLLPKNSHSLATAYFAQNILREVYSCVSELDALRISDEVSTELKTLMECLRWRLMDVLAHDWTRDARLFYHLESWIAVADDRVLHSSSLPLVTKATTTHLLYQFQLFQRYMTTAMYKLASQSHHLPLNSGKVSAVDGKKSASSLAPSLISKITRGFLDAIYHFLDGLIVLVLEGATLPILDSEDNVLMENGRCLHELVDIKDPNIRLLIVIANLDNFGKYVVMSMIKELESTFGKSFSEDQKTLKGVISELDKTLLEAYMRPRISKIQDDIHDAILGPQVDWCKAGQPVAIRKYVFEILNHVVDVHAQVCSVSQGLLDRIINHLIDVFAQEASRCFEKVRRFGTDGLLVAVMEVTFIHKSLGQYGRDSRAGNAIENIYTKQIPKAYAPFPKDPDFRSSFEAMQKSLAEARRATGVQFLCFRKSASKEKERSLSEREKRNNRDRQA